jgi:hypothetical protein
MKSRPCQPGDILASKIFDYGIKYEIKVIEPTEHPEFGVTTDHDVKLSLSIFIPVTILAKIRGIVIWEEFTGKYWGVSLNNSYGLKSEVFSTRDIPKTLVELITFATKECLMAQETVTQHERSILDQKNTRNKIYSQFMINE